ncbi:MAG: hypothetical protein K8L91_27840 [Anaerolineae bacterium]|nr:hypothetical protein [Anaerolineae bacterium]
MSKRFSIFQLVILSLICTLVIGTFSFPAPPATAQDTLPTLHSRVFDGDVVLPEDDPCQLNLPPTGFALGLDKSSCVAGRGGSVTATLDIPASLDRHVLLIRLVCTGTSGCAGALKASNGGEVVLSIDGHVMWSTRCDGNGTCNALALGESPVIAYVADQPAKHKLVLTVSSGLVWSLANVEVEWELMPQTIQGIAYSPYRDCQNPHFGDGPTIGQVHEDMITLRHMANAIRTYSSEGIEGAIPAIARQYGLRVSAGAWLGRDPIENERQIAALVEISQQVELESVIVGNEVLLRGDLSETDLINYIERVREAVNVPVTTADIAAVFAGHPKLVEAVDYVLVHIYAFWEGQLIENAARYVVDQYHNVQDLADGKPVIIGETGWPSHGPAFGPSIPSPENQRRFTREFLALAAAENVEFYYFSAFNELWKTEGGVGAFWGVLDSKRHTQYDFQSVLVPMSANIQTVNYNVPSLTAVATATPVATMDMDHPEVPVGSNQPTSIVFPIYTNYAVFSETDDALSNHFEPSGFMGDIHTISVDTCAVADGPWEERAIELRYRPSELDLGQWAGIYWQTPKGNWGTVPHAGYDLTNYTQVRFMARAATPDSQDVQVQFFVGGINNGEYPSSISNPIYAQEADPLGFVTVTSEWHEYHIDLRGADLHSVIDGFGWVADQEHTPDGVTLYVDNIVFDTAPPPAIVTPPIVPQTSLVILDGSRLVRGFSLGVDTSEEQRDWVMDEGGALRLDYPAEQEWGVVFINVGTLAQPLDSSSLDLSGYDAIAVDLRGEVGGELVLIGVKDSNDPDTGEETKIPVQLTSNWRTYVFEVDQFVTADFTTIQVPLELVFGSGTSAQTVYVRNIRYLRNAMDE